MADTEQHIEDTDKRCTLFDGARRYCIRCGEFHKVAEWSENCERYLGAAPIKRCKTCGGDHPLDRWPGNCMPERNWLESDLPVCRNFISDNLESIGGLNGLQCQASGKWFTSKARMRQEYKARGVIEVGTDSQRFTPAAKVKPKPDKKAIKEAIAKAHNVVFNEGGTVENFVRRRKAKDVGPFGRIAAGK